MGSPWVAVGGEYPKDPAEVGKYQSRDVGEKTRPSAPHTSHVFDNQADKEKLYCYGRISGCLGATMGSPWVAGA